MTKWSAEVVTVVVAIIVTAAAVAGGALWSREITGVRPC